MKLTLAIALGLFSTLALSVPRQEFKISGNTFDFTVPVDGRLPLVLSNGHGAVRLVFVSSDRKTVRVLGTYASASKFPATIQSLTEATQAWVFLDGPAKFKSHDHVRDYGKPLDLAFFRSNVGKIPFVERGEADGEIIIGEAYSVNNGTSSTVGNFGEISFWGDISLSDDISFDDGVCLGKEAATAAITYEVPVGLAQRVKVWAEGAIEISDPTGAFHVKENKEGRAILVRKDAKCDTHTLED